MPEPSTVLSAWQLAVIALVAVAALTAWLVAVFLAARPSRRADQGALASPPGPAQQAQSSPRRPRNRNRRGRPDAGKPPSRAGPPR